MLFRANGWASIIVFITLNTSAALAGPTRILADTHFLKALGIKPLSSDSVLNLSVAEVSEYQANTISHYAHKFGKCGGFERLDHETDVNDSLQLMRWQLTQSKAFETLGNPSLDIPKKAEIEQATQAVSEAQLRETVQWLSSYPTRFHKGNNSNKHVEALAEKINQTLQGSPTPFQVELISHTKTPQKTLRVRIPGSERPQETVILGGHLDSIANWGFSNAPGADDNASGSSNLLEALKIIVAQGQPARSIEFFWYAGEEGGLIGSSEIAQNYRKEGREVIGVLQLDMTLFPGEGELVMGDMNDFTNPWLRTYVKALSDHYVGARWREDSCGYGCSDHASWHRQGYPTVMPFEASFSKMNQNIHSEDDIITPALNFKHSAAFAKLAVAFAMDLGNSTLKATF